MLLFTDEVSQIRCPCKYRRRRVFDDARGKGADDREREREREGGVGAGGGRGEGENTPGRAAASRDGDVVQDF